jgi:hypothetical protein
LGSTVLARGCAYDSSPARSPVDVFRLIAETAEQRGDLKLAENVLESLAHLPSVHPVAAGRVLADRARNSRKQGRVHLAYAQLRELLRHGRVIKSNELCARAWMGLGAVAQTRGNFAEMRRSVRHGLRIASAAGLHRLAATGHAGLGVDASMGGDPSQAISHLWQAYQLSAGDERSQSEFLGNLSHVFLLAGHAEVARAAASAVLRSSPPLRIGLPALGTFAIASAHLHDRVAAGWAARQAQRLARTRGHAREVAGAMIECALAWSILRDEPRAGVLRRRSESLAVKHGFYDLTFREALAAAPAPARSQPLSRPAAAAAAEVGRFGLHVLPSDLDPAATW